MRLVFRFAAPLLLIAGLAPDLAQARPNFIDLSAYQTPLRSQGAQGSCIVFAAVAALEAAYNHAGYGKFDLSEALLNHFGKMMWIEPRWNSTVAKGEDGRESQVGAYSGGGGVQYLKEMANGLRTTVEAAMPYRLGAVVAPCLESCPAGHTCWLSNSGIWPVALFRNPAAASSPSRDQSHGGAAPEHRAGQETTTE
jgi:hypothetical protein